MEYIAEIRADISGYPNPQKLIVKQGDEKSRYAIVTLLEHGHKLFVGTDATVRVAMTKPDGKQVLSDDNVSILNDGTIKVLFTSQMVAVPGIGKMEIGLYKGATLLSSATVDVLIYPSAFSMPTLASSDEYQSLISALADVTIAITSGNRAEEMAVYAEKIAAEVERKLKNGDFIGAQGPQGLQGKQGNTGIVTTLAAGMFELSVGKTGHLLLTHNDNEPVPPLEIKDGRLIYTIS